MSIYKEGGINIDLTAYPSHFRLASCPGYKTLSKFYLKEVDFCWWNHHENCLYISDFKDFSTATSTKELTGVIPNLVDKSIAVIGMLAAVWLKTEGSKDIAVCLPAEVKEVCKLKIVHIIKCEPHFHLHFSVLLSKFSERFYAYRQLFDIETATILTYERAKEELDVIF